MINWRVNGFGRYSINPWPARSADLTPSDIFLRRYLMEHVNVRRTFQNIDEFENVIHFNIVCSLFALPNLVTLSTF